MYMSKPIIQYTVIREYGNLYGLEEFVRRIIQQHINEVYSEELSKGCSDQEVNDYDKKHIG